MTSLTAKKNSKLVANRVENIAKDGKFSQSKLWKLKRKLCPAVSDPPMAKTDENGMMVTAPVLLKALYARTYEHRLRDPEIRPKFHDILNLKNKLWSLRIKELQLKRTPDWNMTDLRCAIKSLKNNKTADPDGIINELFKEGCIGQDLECALLSLFNGIKNTLIMQEFMIKLNITTIFKNKGSRFDMKNERGIFILSSFRKILDKLLYLEKYEDINAHMSDSNIGARKEKQVKDHLDLYDSLSNYNKDEKIALLYSSSVNNLVSVKTAHGLTERRNLTRLVQQGGTWVLFFALTALIQLGEDYLQMK